MLYIIVFLILTAAWCMFLREIFKERIRHMKSYNDCLSSELNGLMSSKEQLNQQNSELSKVFAETLTLYELTKDICQHLDEDKVFATFCRSLKKYIKINDCRYIKDSADLAKYGDYQILPLEIDEKQIAGYLAIDGIRVEDKEKLGILAQQFLIGLKRALLYQKVQGMTITDSLTQVYCRRYFLERFNEELKRSKKNKLKLSFLMADIDNFKSFNDRYGHLVGDAILRQVSKTISEAVRQIDFIGRYGGEELSIVLSETDKEQAVFAAERIRLAIAKAAIKVYDEELKVTVSIGVSVFPDNALNMQDLIEKADQALYLAKEKGKNKACFCPG